MAIVDVVVATGKKTRSYKTYTQKPGQPLRIKAQPDSEVSVLVDNQLVQGQEVLENAQQPRLKRVGQDLVVEIGAQEPVIIEDFYSTKDVSLWGNAWSLDGNLSLQQAGQGVVVSPESAALAPAVVPEAVDVSASALGAKSHGLLGLAALAVLAGGGGGGGAAPLTSTTLTVNVVAGPVNTALTVVVYDDQGNALGQGRTNANGSLTLSLMKTGRPIRGPSWFKCWTLTLQMAWATVMKPRAFPRTSCSLCVLSSRV